MTFDPTKPADGRDSYLVDDDCRDNFVAIQKGEHHTNATAPAYKIEGTLWYDSTNDVLKAYNGTSWDSQMIDDSTSYYDYGTSASTSTAKAKSGLKICFGSVAVTGTQQISSLPFASTTSYKVVLTGQSGLVPPYVTYDAKDKFTITENISGAQTVSWIALGT